MKSLARVLELWTKILGKENIIADEAHLTKAQKATFSTKQKILAVIFPKDRNEVQDCLIIANSHNIPVYPVSTGKNWGYGSMVPPKDSVVMNLSRLNKITDFNEELAYVTVEPGVTFNQLYKFLLDKKSSLTISTIGGSSDSSFIGNLSERGISKGTYGNLYENVSNLEIVLPTGEVINTGFAGLGLEKLSSISREGIGPEIIGLFTQSNFGVITRMTLWLQPRPKYSRVLSFHIEDNVYLGKAIDALRILKLEKTIDGNFLIADEFRALSNFQQYPWKEINGKTPLSRQAIIKVKKNLGLKGKWVGQVVLGAATKEELIGKEKRIRELLGKIIKMIYFIDLKNDFYKPSDFAIRSCYWRKKTPIPKKMDPDRDGCGVLWISPAAPFVGRNVLEVVGIMEKTMMKYGFEENIGVSCLTDRKVYIIGSINYDLEVKEEDNKALKCHDEIFKSLFSKGYFPYRLNIHSMSLLSGQSSGYFDFIKKIKKLIDPNNILAPGRYDRTFNI